MENDNKKLINRVLLVNDDGIDAPGFDILKKIAHKISREVWISAPKKDNSGAGRSLTLRSDIKVNKRDDLTFEVDGTPTDCVILALNYFMKDTLPDLVLSGINAGRNAADDVTYSGTIGAAWEARILGIPSIALSQMYNKSFGMNFSAAENYGFKIIERLIDRGWSDSTVININFPPVNFENVKGFIACDLDSHKLKDDIITLEKEMTFKIGNMITKDHQKQFSDLYYLNEGFVTITPILLNLTNKEVLDNLRDKIDERFI